MLIPAPALVKPRRLAPWSGNQLVAGACESTTPRLVSNASDSEDLVLLVVGGKGGYVERDGHLVDVEHDLPRRQAFGS